MKKVMAVALLGFVGLMAGGIRGACAEQQASGAKLELTSCRPEGITEDLLCGKFSVPEDRAKPKGRMLLLNVIVLPALESDSKMEPLFPLGGTEFAEMYAGPLRGFRSNRDIVLTDQRGLGPQGLNCSGADLSAQGYLGEYFPPQYVKDCAEELSKTADLNQYLTTIAMDDLDEIRAALGYEKIHISGASYFSRAALEYIRRHGDHVSSAILTSPVPPDARMPLQVAAWAQRALNLLFEDCERDKPCARAFPSLRSDWAKVLARLTNEPARVSHSGAMLEIRRHAFVENIRLLMYSPSRRRSAPFVIHQAALGNFTPFLDNAIPQDLSEGEQNMDGWYLSVVCPESTDFARPEEAAVLSRNTDFGLNRYDSQKKACSIWPHASLNESILRPVVSDVPVLIFAGERDPVTPPVWATKVAEMLPNSRLILIPQGAHVSSDLQPAECLRDLAMQFLDGSHPDTLDASCVQKLQPPPFQLAPP